MYMYKVLNYKPYKTLEWITNQFIFLFFCTNERLSNTNWNCIILMKKFTVQMEIIKQKKNANQITITAYKWK